MEKIKKGYKPKFVSLIVAVIFFLSNIAYGDELCKKGQLRPPLLSYSEKTQLRLETELDREQESINFGKILAGIRTFCEKIDRSVVVKKLNKILDKFRDGSSQEHFFEGYIELLNLFQYLDLSEETTQKLFSDFLSAIENHLQAFGIEILDIDIERSIVIYFNSQEKRINERSLALSIDELTDVKRVLFQEVANRSVKRHVKVTIDERQTALVLEIQRAVHQIDRFNDMARYANRIYVNFFTALAHLTDDIGDGRRFLDYLVHQRARNLLLIPGFEMDFDSQAGKKDIVQFMDNLGTSLGAIPDAILKKNGNEPIQIALLPGEDLPGEVNASSDIITTPLAGLVCIYRDYFRSDMEDSPLFKYTMPQAMRHEIVGHYMLHRMLETGKIGVSQLKILCEAAGIQEIEYLWNGEYVTSDTDIWLERFAHDPFKGFMSLRFFDARKDTKKYINSLPELIAFAVGDPQRDVYQKIIREEDHSISSFQEAVDRLQRQKKIINILTDIGILSYTIAGRIMEWDPIEGREIFSVSPADNLRSVSNFL